MRYVQAIKPNQMEHRIVYRNENEYCAWPYNAGMWKISDQELLVGFMNIECDQYSYPELIRHRRVESYGTISAVRSTDGGHSWCERTIIADNAKLADTLKYGKPEAYKEWADFRSPLTLLSCWSTPNSGEDVNQAWIKRSVDGGRSWGPAVLLDNYGIPRTQGRPSYLARPDGVLLLFLTARPESNPKDRPIVYSSFDGGQTWGLHGLLPNNDVYRMICPSPLLLNDGTILAAVRCKLGGMSAFDELYSSEDGGRTWQFTSRINDHGDTCDLTLLDDGRIVAVYGYRRPPFGIRARVSEDNGKTWGPELILRDDGKIQDLGYPRCEALSGNRVFTAYYFNDARDPVRQRGAGTRYIASTLLYL